MEAIRRGGRTVAGFGVGDVGSAATGLYVSDDDLNTARAQWAARMQQLGAAYDAFAKTWASRDPQAFADWTSDWKALQARYTNALGNAGLFTLNSTSYNSLMKAMRACFPPSSCQTSKGDWEDLFNRLTIATKAAGASPPVDVPGHLVGQTFGERLFAETAPLDVVASATGEQARSTALSWFDKLTGEFKTALIIGGVVVAVIVGGVIYAAIKVAPVAASMYLPPPRRRSET
jgi:hypothetical protein